MADFVAELRALAEFCNYGETLNDMLRDRIVCGVRAEHIQRRLLAECNLTLQKALDIAQSMERAVENAATLRGKDSNQATAVSGFSHGNADLRTNPLLEQVLMFKSKHNAKGQREPLHPCFRCAKTGHSPALRKFKNAKCRHCGKLGHIRPACKSREKTHHNPKKLGAVKHVQEEQVECDREYSLFSIPSNGTSKPYTVTLEVAGQQLQMEIDTGASLSLISESTCRKLWPKKRLLPTIAKLKTYSDETLPILGTLNVQVSHNKQKACLALVVVTGSGPSLLGRDWLKKLKMDWQQINHMHLKTLHDLLEEHKVVFEESLGMLNGFKAKNFVDPSVSPRFCKARSVPYSMQILVDEKLDQLVKEKVIEPVEYADWAAPIVPVLKSDKKTVRICGDFKLTVNRAAKLDRYPIPKIEDLFARVAGGQLFTQLDRSQAYQQLLLCEDSKQYVVINTHRGLFGYNRLPYGISSAPGIFQRTMESLLQGIPNVMVNLDDILITGSTEDLHLETLGEVLRRIQNLVSN